MIYGKTVNLRLLKDERECIDLKNLRNSLSERGEFDDVQFVSDLTKEFRETGYWSKKNGLIVITTKDDTIIGFLSFLRRSEFELEIGYVILEKKHRKKGYANEALNIFSTYLFNSIPHITRLKIEVVEDNIASAKTAEKSGYKQEGILRQAGFYKGKIRNIIIYSLLREECLNTALT